MFIPSYDVIEKMKFLRSRVFPGIVVAVWLVEVSICNHKSELRAKIQ